MRKNDAFGTALLAWLVVAIATAAATARHSAIGFNSRHYEGCRHPCILNISLTGIGPLIIDARPLTNVWASVPPPIFWHQTLLDIAAHRNKGEDAFGIRLIDSDGCESVSFKELLDEEGPLSVRYEPRTMVQFNLTVITGPHGKRITLPINTATTNCGAAAHQLCQLDTICLLRKQNQEQVADAICRLALMELQDPVGSRVYELFDLKRYMGNSYHKTKPQPHGQCLSCELRKPNIEEALTRSPDPEPSLTLTLPPHLASLPLPLTI